MNTATDYTADIPATLALDAFRLTSFDPEKRAEHERQAYARKLANFRAYLDETMTDASEEEKSAEFDRYRARARKLTLAWLASHSRCVSAAIVGPARFPYRQQEKRNDVEHRRLGELIAHDEHARASIAKRHGDKLRQPIMSGDADALERLQDKLAKCRKAQELMKAANAAIRKAKGDADKARAALVALGISEKDAAELVKPNWLGGLGFPPCSLQNNNAEIHRIEARIKQITAARERGNEEAESADGVRVEVDREANRVRVYFPGKPDADTRAALKSHGFRWSPSSGAWQAYINPRTTAHAKSYLAA